MSTQTASRALPARRTARTASVTRSGLRVAQPSQEQGGVWFGVLCVALVVAGFVSVLLLNTARAQQQFTINDLQTRSDRLAGTEQDLTSQLAAVSAPQQLALDAQRMGLQPATKVQYVRTTDRKVVRESAGPGTGSGFTVDTLPKTPTSTLAGTAVAAGGQSILIAPAPPKPAPAASKGKADTTAKDGSKAPAQRGGAARGASPSKAAADAKPSTPAPTTTPR